MSLFAEAPASSRRPRSLYRSDCGLLPKAGSAGAPLVVETGLGRAKITCHVNSVDVLVERFGFRLETPRCGLRHGSLCRYHDIYSMMDNLLSIFVYNLGLSFCSRVLVASLMILPIEFDYTTTLDIWIWTHLYWYLDCSPSQMVDHTCQYYLNTCSQ
jgi:hypothetical protein